MKTFKRYVWILYLVQTDYVYENPYKTHTFKTSSRYYKKKRKKGHEILNYLRKKKIEI